MGEECSWKGDMKVVVVMVMTTVMMVMMKFIEENQNVECLNHVSRTVVGGKSVCIKYF
jgi:hypothetical protein